MMHPHQNEDGTRDASLHCDGLCDRHDYGYVVLPPNGPGEKALHAELYVPDLKWLYAGACRAMTG